MATILVVGGGGREHAIVWKLAKSPKADKIYCAPGNGGIAELAECVDISAADVDGIVRFASSRAVDLVVIGPDDPLALGLADALEDAGIAAFGPRKAAARLEWSKGYAKGLMKKYGIPTAAYAEYSDADAALAAAAAHNYASSPLVIKADGLALGKGVIIADNPAAAAGAIRDIMLARIFGDSGGSVVFEEYLSGPEITVLAFTDGATMLPMLSSQDHKRAFDGDQGPNTGGMGAFAPSPLYTPEVERACRTDIFEPTLAMLRGEGLDYRGVLYFGLMLTESGPKVIEYNARFGDPETQAVLPLLKNDLYDIFTAVAGRRLDKVSLEWENEHSVNLVLASGGYPGKYVTGHRIVFQDGLTNTVFHAGTRAADGGQDTGNGGLITAGGRVLGLLGMGATLGEALDDAYGAARRVTFKDMRYRRDIGARYR